MEEVDSSQLNIIVAILEGNKDNIQKIIESLRLIAERNDCYERACEEMTAYEYWTFEQGCSQLPTFPTEPVRFSVDCINDLLKWIPRQDGGVIGCQYMLQERDIMRMMIEVPCEIVVHQQDWMIKPRSELDERDIKTLDKALEMYPQIKNKNGECGISVLSPFNGRYGSYLMHQKWLMGTRILKHRKYEQCGHQILEHLEEHNLACGSFNLTFSAANHYESLFFIDHMEGMNNTTKSEEVETKTP